MAGKSEVEGKPERPAQPQNGRDCSRGEQPSSRSSSRPGSRLQRARAARQLGCVFASVRFLVLTSSLSPRLSRRSWGKPVLS